VRLRSRYLRKSGMGQKREEENMESLIATFEQSSTPKKKSRDRTYVQGRDVLVNPKRRGRETCQSSLTILRKQT
jgi:hypothetical protein